MTGYGMVALLCSIVDWVMVEPSDVEFLEGDEFVPLGDGMRLYVFARHWESTPGHLVAGTLYSGHLRVARRHSEFT